MKKRSMSLFLAVVLTLSLAVPGLAAGAYTDTEGHWAAEAVERWSAKGVLQGSDGAFRPDDTITRAEMAVILDRLMVYITVAKNTFTDVQDGAWYTEALLGASAAGIMKGDGATMRPSASLTRQEAIVLLGRALGVKEDVAAISVFTDAAAVADWAKGYVGGMSAAGIIKGADGRVNPTASITRAEVVTIMDNAVSAVYAAAGTYTEDAAGNVIVSAPGVVLKNMTIRGNLIVAEGVGTGECTLDGVTVKGRAIVRGGGEHSFIVKGNSKIGEISVEQKDSNIRVSIQGNADVTVIEVNDGKSDVIIEGEVGTLNISATAPVTLHNSTIETVNMTGESANLTMGEGAKVGTVAVSAPDATVNMEKGAKVATVAATADATGANVSVAKGSELTQVVSAAPETVVQNNGNLGSVSLSKGAEGSTYVVGESASKTTKLISEDKANLTVTTQAAYDADQAAKAAAEAAAKADADQAKADETAKKEHDASKNTVDKIEGGIKEENVKPPVVDDSGKVEVPAPPKEDKPSTGGGGSGNGGTTTSTTVTDKAGLEAALANTKYSTITISGTIGTAEAYSAYAVARPVTITGGTVYGSFIITAAGVTVRDVTMHTQGANNGPLKNCIDVIGNDVTITGCTFNLDARTDNLGTSFMGNGITVWPYGNAAVNINITGNTFIKLQSKVPNWSAAAIQVVEGLNISRFIGYGDIDSNSISMEITLSNEGGMAANNTYTDCDNAYVHSNWTSGNPAFLYTYATTADQLSAGLKDAAEDATIKLGADMTVSADTLPKLTDTLVFDLNGKTMTLSGQKTLTLSKQDETPVSVTFKNGTLVANNAQATKANIAIESGCSIVLDDVTVTATGTVLYPRGTAAAVTVSDSSITTTGVYAIATNAEAPENGGVVITVEKASLTTEATDKDSCALLINVPGTLTVTDAEITGQRQAVVVRSGTASFTDCTITSAFTEMTWKTDYYTGKWGSGDEVPYGAVVVGKDSTAAYAGDIALNLSGCTISCTYVGSAPDTYGRYASAVYAIDNNSAAGYDVTITVETCTVEAGNVVNYKTAPAVIVGSFSDSEDKTITPMDDIPALVSAVSETEAVAEAEPEADAEMGTEAEPKAEAEADTTTIPSEE